MRLGDKITEEDVKIPNISHGIFPVADHAFFPKRNPKSAGWKIGIKDHFSNSSANTRSDRLFTQREDGLSNNDQAQQQMQSLPEINVPTRPSTAHSLHRANSMASSRPSTADTTTSSNNSNSRPGTAAARRASMIELNKQKRLKAMHTDQQRKKSQYGLRDLPTPAPEVTQKYFGKGAQKAFFNTYSQLKARGEVLVGGYDELCDVILDDPEYNPFMQLVAQLEEAGVLNDATNKVTLTASKLMENNSQFATPVLLSPAVTHRKAGDASDKYWPKKALDPLLIEDTENPRSDDVSPGHEGQDVYFERSTRRSPTKSVNAEGLNILVFDDDGNYKEMSGSGALGDDGQSRMVWSPTSDSVWDCNKSNFEESVPPTPVSVSRLKLNDMSYKDNSLESTYGVASPRAIFLSGCLRHNIPPVTTALIRKKLSPVINLAHMLLGNKLAMILAPSLIAMPYLQVLNLCDNNLQDSGLAAVIDAVSHHDDLAILDISQNVIGSDAARALASFVGNDQCKLKCLRMSDANIDDGECASFVEVLMHNVHLVVSVACMCRLSFVNTLVGA